MPPLQSAAITILSIVVVALAYYWAETLAVFLIKRAIARLIVTRMARDTISQNEQTIPEGEEAA